MSTEEIKALIRREIEEVWNGGNVDTLHETSHEERVVRDPVHSGNEGRGHEHHKRTVSHYRKTFSDLRIDIDLLIVEGDMAAARITVNSKLTGEFMGVQPTGQPVHITAQNMYQIKDGRIVETWSEWDRLGLMQQLGLLAAQAAG